MLDIAAAVTPIQRPTPVPPSHAVSQRVPILNRHNGYRRPLVDSLSRTLKRHHGKLRMKRPSKCVVCMEKASGMYFGAMVCLPCKSFFIRCTKDGKPQLTCLGDKQCSIDRSNRMRCQYCRYQKCLAVGMMRREKPECVEPAEGQELCRVCADIANGIHFGVMTCEGCKKFFRRALKEAETYECKVQQMCTLNPRNRNACRYCRYQKCLDVGMSRQAIRMGRPKKIKSECPSGFNDDFFQYDTLYDPYYCSKINLPLYTDFKVETPVSSYNTSRPSTFQFSSPPSRILDTNIEKKQYPPLSPGSNDSGIESDCGSPIQTHSPTFMSFNSNSIKTEPKDLFEASGCGNTSASSSCQYSYSNQGNNDVKHYQQQPTPQQQQLNSDVKIDPIDIDIFAPNLVTEIDVEDMNDILAALGQHMGSLGPQGKDGNCKPTYQDTNHSNNVWNTNPHINNNNHIANNQYTVNNQNILGSYLGNDCIQSQATLLQTTSYTCQGINHSTNSHQTTTGVQWPHNQSYPVFSNNGFFTSQRQPVFPML